MNIESAGLDEIEFDFNEWSQLAKNDPEAFEARRKDIIEEELAKAPDEYRQRLEQLQWRIDAERLRHKHPLASAQCLFHMMWDQVYGSNGLLDALNGMVGPDELPRPLVGKPGAVVSLQSARERQLDRA